MRSAVLPSTHPNDEKPITDIPIAPITAPQIPGFKLGYFFIYRASVSEESLPLIFPPRIAALPELVRCPTIRLVGFTTRYSAAQSFVLQTNPLACTNCVVCH